MVLTQQEADAEFLRQAISEKRLATGQSHEVMGAQMGLADRGAHRAIPVLCHELGLMERPVIEQVMRHMIRRCGPMRVGRFSLTEQIGRGGMGVVYKAVQDGIRRDVAVKLLLRERMDDQFVERFRRESDIAGRLRHNNLVALIEAGEADGWHFTAMEYLPGGSLTYLVKRKGPLSERRAVGFGARIARALHHAHENGIIHRDVKPANIMISESGEPKLCDLGLAQVRDVDESDMIARGITVGSRRYMSPEQVRGIENVDFRTDIYSLGLTIFFALTGKPPFKDVAKERVMYEHLRGELHWPANEGRQISDDVCWVVMRMAAPKAGDRYNSAADLASDLERLVPRLPE